MSGPRRPTPSSCAGPYINICVHFQRRLYVPAFDYGLTVAVLRRIIRFLRRHGRFVIMMQDDGRIRNVLTSPKLSS